MTLGLEEGRGGGKKERGKAEKKREKEGKRRRSKKVGKKRGERKKGKKNILLCLNSGKVQRLKKSPQKMT